MAEPATVAIPSTIDLSLPRAERATVAVPSTIEPGGTPTSRTAPKTQALPTNQGSVMVGKSILSATNLMKLLPCGTVLAFQALSPSFSNLGICHSSNKLLTALLVGFCTLSCCFFSFTDSFTGRDGKHYYGIATFKGLYILNSSCSEEEMDMRLRETGKFRIRALDFVHAFFSCLVFLALAFSDSDIQKCFFPRGGPNAKELLLNLPLGVAFLSSLVFMIFPTSRKGFGYSDTAHPAH